ncbi:MAG TPA: tyrosine-protein phosphatase, partial [Nocardioides sp.]
MSAAINWLDLDGVVNMRDLGGLPTTDGSTLRPGRLLRSDNLQDLSSSAV